MNDQAKSLQTGTAILAAMDMANELGDPEVVERLFESYRLLLTGPLLTGLNEPAALTALYFRRLTT